MDFLVGQYDEMSIYTSYELLKYAAVFTNLIDWIEDFVFENVQLAIRFSEESTE